jgi:hypothetical protein
MSNFFERRYNVFVDRPFSFMFFAKLQELPGRCATPERPSPALAGGERALLLALCFVRPPPPSY